jgi:hypothetical protein
LLGKDDLFVLEPGIDALTLPKFLATKRLAKEVRPAPASAGPRPAAFAKFHTWQAPAGADGDQS